MIGKCRGHPDPKKKYDLKMRGSSGSKKRYDWKKEGSSSGSEKFSTNDYENHKTFIIEGLVVK